MNRTVEAKFDHKNKYFGDGSNVFHEPYRGGKVMARKKEVNQPATSTGPRIQCIQATGWFRPLPYSDDWQNHGNSVGNGSIIKALPPDHGGRRFRKYDRPPDTFFTHNMHSKKKLMPDAVQAPRVKLAPPMHARAFSPICYDFRGKRVKKPNPETLKGNKVKISDL